MKPIIEPTCHYFQFRACIDQYRHDIARSGESSSLLAMLLRCYEAAVNDTYSFEAFDTIIFAHDPLISLFSAYKLGAEGKRVLIFKQEIGLDENYQKAVDLRYQSDRSTFLLSWLAEQVGASNFTSIDEAISYLTLLVSRMRDNKDRPCVLFAEGGALSPSLAEKDSSGRNFVFWASHRNSTIEPNPLWRAIKARLPILKVAIPLVRGKNPFGASSVEGFNGKVAADHILLTNNFSGTLPDSIIEKSALIGDALIPISRFRKFTPAERVVDYVSAARVISTIKDKVRENEMLNFYENSLLTESLKTAYD